MAQGETKLLNLINSKVQHEFNKSLEEMRMLTDNMKTLSRQIEELANQHLAPISDDIIES